LDEYKLGAFVCTASFQEPAFNLCQQSAGLHKALFRNLRDLGPRFDNFTETGTSSGAAHWSLTLLIPGRGSFRATAQNFESTFLNPGVELPSTVATILQQVESAVAEAIPEATIQTRQFVLNAHFALPPGTYQALTAAFLREPPSGLGVPWAQGMTFYFHTPDSRVASALTLDRSVAVLDGLFFQARSHIDAQRSDLVSSIADFQAFLGTAIASAKVGGMV